MTAIGTSYNGFSYGYYSAKREDGAAYTNNLAGKTTLLESTDLTNPLKLQVDQKANPFNQDAPALVQAFALQVGKDSNNHLISYDARTGKLLIDKKEQALPKLSPIVLSDGTTISRTADNAIRIQTSQGDIVNVSLQSNGFVGSYLEIMGEVSPTRESDSVRGALGAFDDNDDWRDDVYLSTGTQLQGSDLDISGWLISFMQSWQQDAKEDDLFIANTL
ncbi:MAG: hypothetical protein HY692_01030 [Cyanobacteria bacterium NC_groundwater_1444_Ag_S-0.65um_54_12]|nr:hypothetical protein [Cyanobacteria bacterium NC_groundwater_1444_Ag_S-0.65um_54_12]